MVLRIIKNIAKVFIKFYLRKDKTSLVHGVYPKGKNFKGRITLSGGSSLTLGNNIKFNGTMWIKNKSEVVIEDGCEFRDVTLFIGDNSKVFIGKNSFIFPEFDSPISIFISTGNFRLEGENRIACNVGIRFGGKLQIGSYSRIGNNSEIFCDESITIGAYGLFSYDVCIYDSDSHSVSWQKRRERIIAGHPIGTSEIERPNTKPVIIGDDVWLGKGTTITKGTRIGNRCIVGIRTVVGGGDYPDDTSIVSNKPRIITRQISG
jgi:acetyltransferase-like isoleucine patch superfamily enzyme